MKIHMKDYIQFETKIGLNSGSYRTSIPKEIAEYFEITTDEKLLWRLNIKTNEITIIPVPKTSKNTSDDIHETNKKSKDSTVNIHETNKKPENKTTTTDTNNTNKENKSGILKTGFIYFRIFFYKILFYFIII